MNENPSLLESLFAQAEDFGSPEIGMMYSMDRFSSSEDMDTTELARGYRTNRPNENSIGDSTLLNSNRGG
jgi:hypothetical protein